MIAKVGMSDQKWQLSARAQAVADDGQILSLRKAQGAERVTSRMLYRFATLELEICVGRLNNGLLYYLGFISREPWAKNVAWLVNDAGPAFFLRTAQGGKTKTVCGSSTRSLVASRWYPVKLVWKQRAVDRRERQADMLTMFFDGKELGTFGDLESMPSGSLPVVSDVISQMAADATSVSGSFLKHEIRRYSAEPRAGREAATMDKEALSSLIQCKK